jgi:hypothetical protein
MIPETNNHRRRQPHRISSIVKTATVELLMRLPRDVAALCSMAICVVWRGFRDA